MPTNKPRINVTLTEEQNSILMQLAKKEGKSASATAADLIEQALDLQEDKYWSDLTNKQIENDNGVRYTHEEVWKDL